MKDSHQKVWSKSQIAILKAFIINSLGLAVHFKSLNSKEGDIAEKVKQERSVSGSFKLMPLMAIFL